MMERFLPQHLSGWECAFFSVIAFILRGGQFPQPHPNRPTRGHTAAHAGRFSFWTLCGFLGDDLRVSILAENEKGPMELLYSAPSGRAVFCG